MPPAARLGDVHVCPATTGPTPHVGGPLLPRPGTVLVAGAPAITSGDLAVCSGSPAAVVAGSATVYFDHRKAAREGDETSHGGKIASGCPTVLVDDRVWGGAAPGPSGPTPPASGPAGAGRSAAFRARPLRSGPTAEGIRAQRETLLEAARAGTPFAEPCEREPPDEDA